jgi:hypothetical protein
MDPQPSRSSRSARRLRALVGAGALFAAALPAGALDVQGTVTLAGQVLFATAVAGMDAADLRVSVDGATDATGPGVKCSVVSSTNAVPDGVTGAYSASAEVLMERGGPQLPEGACLLTLRAAGWDGVATSAHASTTLLVSADDLQASAVLSPAVLLARVSRPAALLSADCKR